MYSRRDIGMMIAGAQLFHTFNHILLLFSGSLPIYFFFFTFTYQMNILMILLNGLIAVALLKWASKLK